MLAFCDVFQNFVGASRSYLPCATIWALVEEGRWLGLNHSWRQRRQE